MNLLPGAQIRTARREWRCIGADQIFRWMTCAEGPLYVIVRHTETREEAEALADELRTYVRDDGERQFDQIQVQPMARPRRRSTCAIVIPKGSRYIEWRDDMLPWQSGQRFCMSCGAAELALRHR